jgi:hypothetical protein
VPYHPPTLVAYDEVTAAARADLIVGAASVDAASCRARWAVDDLHGNMDAMSAAHTKSVKVITLRSESEGMLPAEADATELRTASTHSEASIKARIAGR